MDDRLRRSDFPEVGQKMAFVHCTKTMITMTIPMRMPMMNLPTGGDCPIGIRVDYLGGTFPLAGSLRRAVVHHSP